MDMNHKKNICTSQNNEKRLTTAPLRDRPKYNDFYKTNTFQLPSIKKKYGNRQITMVSKQHKKTFGNRKQQSYKIQHGHEQIYKRPQTSKGSRNTIKNQSQFYEEGEDDLVITSGQDKLDKFKKNNKDHICIIKNS